MSNYDSVGILGGGSWGTTLAHLAGINNQKTLLWLRDKNTLEEINSDHCNKKYTDDFTISENVTAVDDLEEIAKRCEIIVVAIPSSGFRQTVYKLGNYVKGDQILISACKGLESKTYARMTTILAEETCCKKIGVLAGPNLYKEILRDHPSATVIASHFHEVISKGLKIFAADAFRVYGNDDVIGVELGGAIKNVIAIAAGIVDGMGYGDNTKSLLVTRGITEMSRIGAKSGANPLTFTGLTGVGDTMVTCGSRLSRNNQVGYYLAQGQTLDYIRTNLVSVAEGINTAKVIHEFASKTHIEIPIINGVYDVLYENKPIEEVIAGLMQRKSFWEIDPTFRQ